MPAVLRLPEPPQLVLLDRDGVLNRNLPESVCRPADWKWLPGAIEAVRLLTRSVRVMVVTNQGAVGRGLLQEGVLHEIHRSMLRDIGVAALTLDDVLFCPHQPVDACGCRKPQAGLLVAAMNRAGVLPSQALMVGDHETDIAAARAAGCWSVHVKCGRGEPPREWVPGYLGSMPSLLHVARALADPARSDARQVARRPRGADR